jgi:hypothetical protein
MRLQVLKDYFARNAGNIVSLLEENSFLILEPLRIRILA